MAMATEYPPFDMPPGQPQAPGARMNYDALRSAAYEEGAHAVAFEAEGSHVERLSVDGRGGGRCTRAIQGKGRPPCVVGLVAGQVGARMFAERGPQYRLRHVGDDEMITFLTGGRRDLRERAERRAREILSCHARTVRAIAERLLAVGVLEGAELDYLLLPVRVAYLEQFASRRAAA